MHALLKLSRGIDWLNTTIGKGVIWLIFASTMISAGNAVVRKIFNMSSNGWLEIQWYLYAWAFLVAAGFTLLEREHVRIDVLNSRLPRRTQVWIDVLGYALFLTPLCLTVLYLCMPLVIQKIETGEGSSQPGGLIRWPVWVAIPIGFTLLMLQGWSECIKCIAFLRGQGPDPSLKDESASDEADLLAALKQPLDSGDTPAAVPARTR